MSTSSVPVLIPLRVVDAGGCSSKSLVRRPGPWTGHESIVPDTHTGRQSHSHSHI